MKQEKKLLEVGDVVYKINVMHNNIQELTITRTTKTLAISTSGYRFRREVVMGDRVVRYGKTSIWNSHSFKLPTPELEQKIQLQNLKREVLNTVKDDIDTLTLPQLLSIQSILQNQTPEKEEVVGWIKVEDLDVDKKRDHYGEHIGFGSEPGLFIGGLSYDNKDGWEICVRLDGSFEWRYVKVTHVIPTNKLLKLPNLNTPPKPTPPTPPLVEWVDSANYNPHNIGESGMIGLGEDGVVWSGNFTYSESEGWSIAIYKGDGYKYVKITHIILKSNLLHLPKK